MLVLLSRHAWADAYVVEIANGASFERAENSGIAPGSIFVIRGSGLGPGESVSGVPPYTKRLPDASGGTRVVFRDVHYVKGLRGS